MQRFISLPSDMPSLPVSASHCLRSRASLGDGTASMPTTSGTQAPRPIAAASSSKRVSVEIRMTAPQPRGHHPLTASARQQLAPQPRPYCTGKHHAADQQGHDGDDDEQGAEHDRERRAGNEADHERDAENAPRRRPRDKYSAGAARRVPIRGLIGLPAARRRQDLRFAARLFGLYGAMTRHVDLLFASTTHAPDGAVAVLREDERAVLRLRDADWPAPHRAVVDHEAGDEVLVLAGRHTILQDGAHDLVARARCAVPGAVQGRKSAALETFELVARIEHHLQRRRMRLQQYVRDGDLVLEVAPLADMPWVLVRPHIVPGPAVEAALAHAREIVRREIVAKPVPLVGRAPEVAR